MDFKNDYINTNMKFEEFHVDLIEQKGRISKETTLEIEIDDSIILKDSNQIEVSLELFVSDTKSDYTLRIKLVGCFYVDSEYNEILRPNLLAIMFPYIRAAVSYLGSIDGNNLIILPPINFNEYVKQKQEKKGE